MVDVESLGALISVPCGIVESEHGRAQFRIDRCASTGVGRELPSEHNHSERIRS